jgi:hypothetical protein
MSTNLRTCRACLSDATPLTTAVVSRGSKYRFCFRRKFRQQSRQAVDLEAAHQNADSELAPYCRYRNHFDMI